MVCRSISAIMVEVTIAAIAQNVEMTVMVAMVQ